MRKVRAVIRREYVERVRTKAFLFSTFGVPVLFVLAVGAPIYLSMRQERRDRQIAVLDRTGVLYERVRARLAAAGYDVERVEQEDPAADARQVQRVLAGDLAGYLVLDSATLARGHARYRGRSVPGELRRLALRQSVVGAALEERLARTGTGGEGELLAFLGGGSLEVEVLGSGQEVEPGEAELADGFVWAFLLYFVILFHAVSVMRAVLEEKTGRIVEVVISAVRPAQLMFGKVLGVGAVGLTQLAVWIGFGLALARAGAPILVARMPELAAQIDVYVSRLLPSAALLTLMLALFLLGYFLYAALYAAIGAMCSSEQEAQQAQTPVVLLLGAPVMLLTYVIEHPGSTWTAGLSIFPFFSPVLLMARAAGGSAEPWQIAAALVLLVGAVGAVTWAAGRIYRVGILMQGKRPTLAELSRWVREG